jgi:Zn-dependent protease
VAVTTPVAVDDVDRVLVLVAAVAVTVGAAWVRTVVAAAVGDETPRVAGVLSRPWVHVDRTGTLLVPAFVALASGAAVAWPARTALRPGALGRGRQALVALAMPLTALLVAGVATALSGGDDAVTVWAAVGLVLAGFWLVPAPPLPGGALVGLLLRGDAADRWQRWARRSVTPYGLVAGVVVVLADVGERVLTALAG